MTRTDVRGDTSAQRSGAMTVDTFGKSLTTGEPGSVQHLLLVVSAIDSARADLVNRGVEVSEVFHLAGGPVPGRDPERHSYQSCASFSDLDGNRWLLEEITTRLRAGNGRTPRRTSHPRPACCTRRPSITTRTRRPMPRTTGGTGSPLTCAREHGDTPEETSAAPAGRCMAEVKHVAAL
jgi:hypothetical protein